MIKENVVKILWVGIGGYGGGLFKLFESCVERERYQLVGAVDPFVKEGSIYNNLVEEGVTVYKSLDEFYLEGKADLAVICSPLHLHKEQILKAIEQGSHVFCEKPLVPLIQDALEIQRVVNRSQKLLGVGFQWSFSNTMLSLKKDILKGLLGKPIKLKTVVSWKREDAYYDSWKGCIKDKEGNWLLDSIVTNATSHYLHNIFFILGEGLSEAKMPTMTKASTYRAKNIESFDTCFLEGSFDNGCEYFYCASHSALVHEDPKFYYEFEKAIVSFNMNGNKNQVIANFRDGTRKVYGQPQSNEELSQKLVSMLDAITEGNKIPCDEKTVIPHIKITNAIFEHVEVARFPANKLVIDNQNNVWVNGLYEEMMACFREGKGPKELGYQWAVENVMFDPRQLSYFTGSKFKEVGG